MKTKIYKTLFLAQCLFAMSILAQAQFPDFTRVETGAVYNSTGAHYARGWFDMDQDGDMDLIIVPAGMYQRNRPNLLYRNERNGLFVKITEGDYPNTKMYTAQPGPIGDIDNDGDEDLILCSYGDFWIAVFKNDLYGNLERDTSYYRPGNPFLIDLNNDSFLDLVLINDNGFVSLNDGTGNSVFSRLAKRLAALGA